MTNSVSLTWLSQVLYVVHGLFLAGVLVIVFVGWKRHRQMGYAVLVAWALVALFNLVGQTFFVPLVVRFLQKGFPRTDYIQLIQLSFITTSLISTLLLFAGLALLVFRPPAAPPRG